ncbi:hypothetical protein B0H13DRAFT_2549441 [Mycena leptocephala]|nr:hypothetical protein B0H13DRAFT_2549441 [Mycena leptocephala]
MPRTRKARAFRYPAPDLGARIAPSEALFGRQPHWVRVRERPRNKTRPKGKRYTHGDRAARIGNTPSPGTKRIHDLTDVRTHWRKERGAAGKTCAPASSAVDAQSKHPPLSPRKKTRTLMEDENQKKTHQHQSSQKCALREVERGGGGGSGWMSNINGAGTKHKVREDGRERRREGKQRIGSMEEGGRRNKGGREEWRRQQGRRGNESNGRGYGRPATAHPPYARTKFKTKDSPSLHTPAPQIAPPSPPSVSPTSAPVSGTGYDSAPSARTRTRRRYRRAARSRPGLSGRVASLGRGASPLRRGAAGQVWGGRGGRTGKGLPSPWKGRAAGRGGVRWECEEQQHAKGRGGVNGPAQPNAHVLDFWHGGLVPTDEGRFRAGWRGQGDGGWKNGRIGVAVSVVVRGQRGQVV